MTEEEYVNVSDLQRLRIVADILRSVMDKEAKEILPIIYHSIDKLEGKVSS